MSCIVECVPNISEGRDREIVGRIAAEVKSTPGVALLDFSSDYSHNRTVITFLGDPAGVENAAVALAKKAVELIDLTKHRGAHPRMGAVDVIPFIPIRGVSMEECVNLSRRAGKRIWEEAGLPVFLYEASASAPNRAKLEDVRRGQFEGMAQKVLLPEWEPDFGGRTVHPTAGIAAVGARKPLVAFNINLSTPDLAIASDIARTIRSSGGGLPCVKAIGVMLEKRRQAQVSINMTDCGTTPLYRVLELVRAEARRRGVSVAGTEIVGLAPMDALTDSAAYYLQLEDFSRDKVLESHLL